ncbi:MAG: ABC transporter permease [Bryobacteraceae bacterium]|jgi:putative ABC transport system permease protein
MNNLLQDLRYAIRNLLKSRGLTAIAAATLAIGIGANTAIFSIVDTLLLRPLPFRNPEQLVALNETEAAPGKYPFAGPDFIDWKKQNATFQDMTLFGWSGNMNLSSGGRPESVHSMPTEANYFSLLGVSPLLGRTWSAGEDQPGKDQVAILSYGLWRSRFAGDPAIVGRVVKLNSKPYTIIGVMPASFRMHNAQLWIPLDMDGKTLGQRGSHWANAIGRMKPGVTVRQAQAELTVIASRLEKQYPGSNDKVGAAVTPLHERLVGESRAPLLLLLGAVGLVLLIACANVANLLLSKAVTRQKEMAIRSALGAARRRLVRQLLTESVLLSASGGAAGLLLAWGAVQLFARLESLALPQFNTIGLNLDVLAFTCVLAIATGVLFGIFPAFQASRPDLHEELKGGAGSSVSPGRRRRFASNALVVSEVALSLLLLVCAGHLLEDFARVRSLDIGVRTAGVWTAGVMLPESGYKEQTQQFRFQRALLERTAQIPGVESAALSNRLPLEGGSNGYIVLRGEATAPMSNQLVETHAVSPGYFRVMGIRMLKGRDFTPADIQQAESQDAVLNPIYEKGGTPPAAQTNQTVYPVVINESMARFFWKDRNPIGQEFSWGARNGPWNQVIGVVNDVRQWGLTLKPVPEAYSAFDGDSRVFLVLHTSLPPATLTPQVRRVLAQLDSSLPLFGARTMDEIVGEQAQGQRFLSGLVGSFAVLAVLLAAIGIYGVLSYAVTARTREIGIRMSLGASQARTLFGVLAEGMRLAAIGFVVGAAGAFAGGRVLSSLLHEVKPGDPVVFIATASFLAVVALTACYLPARRAARLDPMVALREE